MMSAEIFKMAKSWVLEAGEIVRNSFNKEISVEFKTSASDLVTQMDRGIEHFFIKKIAEHYPDHFVLGEEGVSKDNVYNPKEETVWIIDPIDGTTNFVHQKRNFTISVGIFENGEPLVGFIYDPVADEMFTGQRGIGAYFNGTKLNNLSATSLEYALISFNPIWLIPNEKYDYEKLHTVVEQSRGVRCLGSASLEMAYIACGRLDAYIDFRLSSWDIAGGLVILDELGATLTTVHGEPIDIFHPSTTLFSRPGLSNEIIKIVGK